MSVDAQSPFGGWGWIWVSLTTAAVLLMTAAVMSVVVWRRRWGWGYHGLLGVAVLGALWTATSTVLDEEVTITDSRNPGQQIECLIAGPVYWSGPCGHAYAWHLVTTLGPSVVLALAVLSGAAVLVARTWSGRATATSS